MALPGKLTIGYVHEDNPVKFYFRFCPLISLSEAGFEPVDEGISAQFPEDGFIRIVPDKNEISLFKTRMRQLGRYCLLDLRRHPNENDKIRPNKNYAPESAERNAHIVYSDVISSLSCEMAVEVLDATGVFDSDAITLRASAPGTRFVAVRRDNHLSGPWAWTETPDIPGCISLSIAPGFPRADVPLDEARILDVETPEGTFTLMYNPAILGLTAPVPETEKPEPREAAPALPDAQVAPLPVQPAPQPVQAVPPQPILPTLQPVQAATPPQSAQPTPLPIPAVAPAQAAQPPQAFTVIHQEAAPPQPAPQPEEAVAKAWITKDESYPRAVSRRMREPFDMQTGINPRRGRSLNEVVDEQWRRSRCDQLGHPVPPEATSIPVMSPIDRALEALREAWALPAARESLLKALEGDEAVGGAIRERYEIPKAQLADEAAERLEASRLQLITEIDALRLKRQDMRQALMQELRDARRDEFSRYEQQNEALRREVEKNEEAAAAARKAAEAAEKLLEETSDKLEEKLLDSMASSHARELLLRMTDGHRRPVGHPEVYAPTAGELISDLRVQMDAAGYPLSNDEAVNLVASMVVGGTVILSGAPGTGKSGLARALVAALGLASPASRFLQTRSAEDPALERLLEGADDLTLSAALIDDVNDLGGDVPCADIIALQERIYAKNVPVVVVLTAQDSPDGKPLSARLLGRAFLIRLSPAAADAPWKPRPRTTPQPDRSPSLASLHKIFAPSEIPGEVENRLNALRQGLAGIGWTLDRHTLDQTWAYCAAVTRMMTCTPLEALDWALSQRALPAMLAAMDLPALRVLPSLLTGLPRCKKLMDEPLPLPPL